MERSKLERQKKMTKDNINQVNKWIEIKMNNNNQNVTVKYWTNIQNMNKLIGCDHTNKSADCHFY